MPSESSSEPASGQPDEDFLAREAAIAACDPALASFLRAPTEYMARQRLDLLVRDFISLTVTATLAFELRRGGGPHSSTQQLRAETEEFEEISVIVNGKIAQRLIELRDSVLAISKEEPFGGSPIRDLSRYAASAARHGYVDYLRQKRPGRHALDTALRVALQASPDLALWQVPLRQDFYYEWRCGQVAWRDTHRPAIHLSTSPVLRSRIWQELSRGGSAATALPRKEVLRRIFILAEAPLLYRELLEFLAEFWDVEAPYRAAEREASSLRAPRIGADPAADPEDVVRRMGALQELWTLVQPLSARQKAVLLLRLPSMGSGNLLEEIVRLGIASEEQVAQALDLSVETLRLHYSDLPLSDAGIADLLGFGPDAAGTVRSIRQDARRRLSRLMAPQ
jgi:hypothetical protein